MHSQDSIYHSFAHIDSLHIQQMLINNWLMIYSHFYYSCLIIAAYSYATLQELNRIVQI